MVICVRCIIHNPSGIARERTKIPGFADKYFKQNFKIFKLFLDAKDAVIEILTKNSRNFSIPIIGCQSL